jgi:hypothetical protein
MKADWDKNGLEKWIACGVVVFSIISSSFWIGTQYNSVEAKVLANTTEVYRLSNETTDHDARIRNGEMINSQVVVELKSINKTLDELKTAVLNVRKSTIGAGE